MRLPKYGHRPAEVRSLLARVEEAMAEREAARQELQDTVEVIDMAEEAEAMEPLPLETLVEYHGSEVEGYGRYRVWRRDGPLPQPLLSDEELAAEYPDGVGYSLWPEGVARKFGLRHLVVANVRRGSLTVISEDGPRGGAHADDHQT